MTGPRLTVWTHGTERPSFRYRIAPILARWTQLGGTPHVVTVGERDYLRRVWRHRHSVHGADIVLLHKTRLLPLETAWLASQKRPLALDVDDAIWLSQPRSPGAPAPSSRHRNRSFRATCRACDLILAGNPLLADQARSAGGRHVLHIPTGVDNPPQPPFVEAAGPVAVWIGTAGNLFYLDRLLPVWRRLAQTVPGFRLRIVCSRFPDWPDVPVEAVVWKPGIEAHVFADAAVGVMPLPDDAFTQGKCGFKLLQYMAAGLPCVASPVGVNVELMSAPLCGLLATTLEEWEHALRQLLLDPALRGGMGRAGRMRAVSLYNAAHWADRACQSLLALRLPGDRGMPASATID